MSIQPKIFKTSCTSWWMSTLLLPSCKSISVVVVFRQDAAVGDTNKTKQSKTTHLVSSPPHLPQTGSWAAHGKWRVSGPPPGSTCRHRSPYTPSWSGPARPWTATGTSAALWEVFLKIKKKRRRENDQEIIRWKNEMWLNGQTRSVHYLTDSGINGGGLANLMSGWVTFQTSVEDPGAVKCLLLQSHHHI